MKITDAFLGEHGLFNVQLQYLQGVVPKSQNVSHVWSQVAMLLAALQTHADLEEALLFTRLEPHLGKQNSLIAVLRAQHKEIEVTLAKLLETDRLYTVQDLLLRVVDLMVDHFSREEEVLYPAAERLLGEGVLTELGEQWAERRDVTVRTNQSGQ